MSLLFQSKFQKIKQILLEYDKIGYFTQDELLDKIHGETGWSRFDILTVIYELRKNGTR